MARVDVTVLGAGAFGLSIAFACLKRGASVRVIDPNGVAAGASGGIVGALAPHVPDEWNDKKAFQLDSLLMAQGFWDEVARLGGQDPGYLRSGRLQPLADAFAVSLAQARALSSRDLWQGKALWQVVDDAELGSWKPHSPTGAWVRDSLSARVHPRRATHALAAAVTALGGEIIHDGTRQGKIVHATGWQGLVEVSVALGKTFGNGVKGQALLVEYAATDAPQVFTDGVHFVPHADGTLAIGSTSERYFDDATSTDAQVIDLHARAIAAMPQVAGAAILATWAGVRPRAKTRSPILGPHPLYPGEFIANGGFKIGFGMAPKVGAVMADLILDGQDAGIPPGFAPQANL